MKPFLLELELRIVNQFWLHVPQKQKIIIANETNMPI
jgi:hypothetical protein